MGQYPLKTDTRNVSKHQLEYKFGLLKLLDPKAPPDWAVMVAADGWWASYISGDE